MLQYKRLILKRRGDKEMYSPIYYYGYTALRALPIALMVAIILGVVLYCTFLRKENEGKFTGWKEVVYNFFNFNKFYLEEIMKLCYVLITAVLVVLGVFVLFLEPATGIIILILGNVAVRISYELIMMFIILCKKTVSIDKKMDRVVAFYGDDFDEGDCSGCGEDEEDDFTCDGGCSGCSVEGCGSRTEE